VGETASVGLSDTEPPVDGIVEGVDGSGRLVLRTGEGPRTFAAGDVTLRAR